MLRRNVVTGASAAAAIGLAATLVAVLMPARAGMGTASWARPPW